MTAGAPSWRIRRARLDDGAEVAALHRRVADAEWSFMAPHTPAEDRFFGTGFLPAASFGWRATARRSSGFARSAAVGSTTYTSNGFDTAKGPARLG